MRTETKIIEYYTFEELDEKAKEKARDWFRQGNDFDHEWNDIVYDAKQVGLKLTAWDYGRYAKGEFINPPEDVAELIIKEHGEMCDTHKTAKQFMFDRAGLIAELKDGEELEDTGDYADLVSEFLKSLVEDYRVYADKQFDYTNSDEAVDENIKCNDYEFSKEGKRI